MTKYDICSQNKDFIIKEYQSGKSTRYIGNKLNVNHSFVRQCLINNGIDIRSNIKFDHPTKYKNEIINLFQSGKSTYSIAKQYNMSNATVHRFLKDLGYNVSRDSKSREDPIKNHIEDIIQFYQDGKSIKEISKIYSCGTSSISRVLSSHKIDTRPLNKYTVNHQFFSTITPNSAYILGFAYADGNVMTESKGIKRHQFRISICDKDHLENMRQIMEYTGPLLPRGKKSEKHQEQWELSICSQQIVDDLIRLGCVPNKTFKIDRLPCMPDKMMGHFLRGYLDGDGSIGNYQLCSLVGNLPLLQDICRFVGVTGQIYDRWPTRKTLNRTLMLTRRDQSIKFLDFIYNDSENYLRMDRKYQKYINPTKRVHNKEKRRKRYLVEKSNMG